MTKERIAELRELSKKDLELAPELTEALDEIERLRAALEPVSQCGNCGGCRDSARKALEKK